jgi:hypothetical protein
MLWLPLTNFMNNLRPEQVHSRPQSGRARSKRQKLKRKRTFSKKKANPGDSSPT